MNKNQFIIQDFSRFRTTKEVVENSRGFRKWINNPSKDDLEYKPRLTLLRRGSELNLKIEFSVPKIIFGNNLDEIDEKDFDLVIKNLLTKLEQMEIWTRGKFLKKAEITSFHPSKNILLTNGYTSSFAIKELSKVNLNKKMDFSETKFRNDGSSIQYYSVSHSLVIYDKIYDLKQSKSRAVDKDKTSGQMSLFKEIQNSKKHIEVLRIEVRLSKKRKMNEVLQKLNYPTNPTFQNVIKKKLCQGIVKSYWESIISERNLFLFDMTSSPLRILQKKIKNDRNIKPKQAIYLSGLEVICKDKGIRELRNTLGIISKSNTWYRINKDIDRINSHRKELELHGFVRDIEENINNFNAFNLKSCPLQKLKCKAL